MAVKQKLVWNGSDYEGDYQGNRLYVSGDAWVEARLARARALFQELHHELSGDAIIDAISEGDAESEACFQQAAEELLDPDEWAEVAVEVDENGDPLVPTTYSFDAWIIKQSEEQ